MTVRRAYHAPMSAVLFAGATLLLGVGATNSQNNLLFLAFGVAVATFVVSGFVSGRMMMGITARRELPEAGAVGEPLTIRYEVTCANRLVPGFAVRVGEVASSSFLPKAPAPSWAGLMPPPQACVAHIGPGETVSVFTTVTPARRGVARFTGVQLKTSFPFGVFTKSVSVEDCAELPILPRMLRLRREVTAALMGRAPLGAASAPQRGAGDDFYGLREYQPGDSSRVISWRATARLGAPVVREHATPRSGALMVILNLDDGGAGPASEEDVEQAITLAASLIADTIAQGLDVGLAAPSHDVLLPLGSGARRRFAALSALASIDSSTRRSTPVSSDELTRTLARLAPRAARVVVHAGAVDPTFGPPDAAHLSSHDLTSLALEPEPAPATPEATFDGRGAP